MNATPKKPPQDPVLFPQAVNEQSLREAHEAWFSCAIAPQPFGNNVGIDPIPAPAPFHSVRPPITPSSFEPSS